VSETSDTDSGTPLRYAPGAVPFTALNYRIMPGSVHLLPMCDVYLLGPRSRVLVRSVLDSGAVYSVFHISAAQDAGLQLPNEPNWTVHYGGSAPPGWCVRTHIEIDRRRWDTEIVFVEKLDLPYGLLGRRGVFGQYNEVAFLERVSPQRVELRW
jgi:hypothetical protein